VHSEVDIPQTLRRLQSLYPHVTLRYAWPFDMTRVAQLLAEHLQQFA
jgi:sirohydrochlorin cobaltochelatase